MRWDALFEDLESQFDALQEGDLYGEVADRIRAEVGKITVLDRLRGAVDTVVRVELAARRAGPGAAHPGREGLPADRGRALRGVADPGRRAGRGPSAGAVGGAGGRGGRRASWVLPTCCAGSPGTVHR